MKIRLVSFDLLHTLITPRYPIHVQYARVFEPYLGPLNPDDVQHSFRIVLSALKQLRDEKPFYDKDASSWWSEVIRRTALGAGAEPKVLENSLSLITPRLIKAFSSKEGYKAFDDSLPTLRALHHDLDVKTAAVSNGDSRILSVLKDLDFPAYLNPIILSEAEGVEKPSPKIFDLVLQRVNVDRETPITPAEWVHVGDDLMCDYFGAHNAGLHALLLDRPGAENQRDAGVEVDPADVVNDMNEVLEWYNDNVYARASTRICGTCDGPPPIQVVFGSLYVQ
ncbi:putative hydrolase C7D4.05 [Mycena venus]|uniref:Putative hydrolase C7D4.05 n=1 Tax=Mycena venus TaxID=2733690 RepID=A0A8H7D7M5_9AGAR|nr:putative hydrolase C7D4.05 [Mycena venus]